VPNEGGNIGSVSSGEDNKKGTTKGSSCPRGLERERGTLVYDPDYANKTRGYPNRAKKKHKSMNRAISTQKKGSAAGRGHVTEKRNKTKEGRATGQRRRRSGAPGECTRKWSGRRKKKMGTQRGKKEGPTRLA